MELETAPSADDDEDAECAVCDSETPFVLYEGDKVCTNCGYVPSEGDGATGVEEESEWSSWRSHRREEYSGWYGEDRIKFVGGFASAYDFGADFE